MFVRDAGGAELNPSATERRAEPVRAHDTHTDLTQGASSRTGEQNFIATALRFAILAAGAAPRQAPDVRRSLDAVWEAYGAGYAQGGAEELARQLRTGDDAFDAELVRRLTAGDSEAAVRILRAAGSEPVPYGGDERVSSADGLTVARALGGAYDRGLLGSDFARRWVQAEADYVNRPGNFGDWPYNEYTGNLVAQSGSARLMRDYANAAIAHAADPQEGNDLHFVNGAARAAAGDPTVLADLLRRLDAGQMGDRYTLENFLGALNTPRDLIGEDPERAVRGESPLAALLNGAARMTDSELKLKIFNVVAPDGDFTEGRGVADALVRLYQSDARRITDAMIDTSASLDGVVTLSQFFRHTLYNADCTLKESLITTAVNVSRQYRAENRPNELGLFAGTVANGFQLAVKDEEKRREAVKNFVGFVFELVPVGGKLKDIFGKALGSVVGDHVGKLIAEKGVEGAQDAVSDYLVGQLTEETGLFGWGNGAKLKSRNDVDEILRGAFEVGGLRDTNPLTPENDGLQSYNNGLGTAYDALEGSGLL
ncbi:MAG TPA: hypothetical protein VGX48_11040 [Pyrinomonadaceae bacterium]|jgi:hypothetical protein|nr:hypothetical protein [Pyrinomonadaceae bacterium]